MKNVKQKEGKNQYCVYITKYKKWLKIKNSPLNRI